MTALAPVGPAIAVGEPSEKPPRWVRPRHYIRAATGWRDVVRALMDRASGLVFVLGENENLFWEFRTAVERRDLHRLLIVVPPVPRQQLRSRWRSLFDSHAGLLGSHLVPASVPRDAVAIGFLGGCAAVMGASHRRRSSIVTAVRLFGHLADAEVGSCDDLRVHLARRAPPLVGTAA